jgi:demethylmenaquinone methyltransferase / 2-methoxy-6-polyprenyl-1,4-benzoquinol methylase
MARAQLDRQPREVAQMFDAVASRYDRMNAVMTMGQERRWRKVVARELQVGRGDRVLDLAAGTGASSVPIQALGASPVACDFSLGMLSVGKTPRPQLDFVAGDALRLPFADNAFAAVTISFGLRNVADPAAALAEMRRVTRPGGRLLICEFSHLASRRLDAVYGRALAVGLPAVARRLSPNPDAYAYLAESIGAWPGAPELAGLIRTAGWSAVRWRSLSLGVVALHHATNPGGPAAEPAPAGEESQAGQGEARAR